MYVQKKALCGCALRSADAVLDIPRRREVEIKYLRRKEIGNELGVVAAELRVIMCADGSPCRGAFCSANAVVDTSGRRRIEEY